jgi:NitT/TauT family transport system substrate-binding protein
MSRSRSLAFSQNFLLAGLTLLSGTADAADAEKLTVQMEWTTLGYHAPFYLAVGKGWFKDAGLDVSITPGSGSNTTVQLVAGGKSDIGHASLASMAFARGQGVPVIATANFFRTGDICLLVPNDSPMRTVADLRGKRLVATAASMEAPFIDAFLAAGGLTRGDVQVQHIDFVARNSIYARGEVDGIFGTPVGTGVQLEKLRPSRCILFADYGLNLPGFGIFATREMLEKRGKALRAFSSIVAGSWSYIISSPTRMEEAIDVLAKARATDRLDRADLMKQLQASIPFLHSKRTRDTPIGVGNADDWADAIAVMEKAKVINPGTKPTDYFTNDYLDLDLIRRIGGS